MVEVYTNEIRDDPILILKVFGVRRLLRTVLILDLQTESNGNMQRQVVLDCTCTKMTGPPFVI
jgi:hypothetical protein